MDTRMDFTPTTPQRQEEPAAPADPLASYREGATIVARDSTFNGTLNSNGNLFVEGNFEGELDSRSTVVIAEGARVKATIRATDVIVAGQLDGTVEASGRFHSMPTAHVDASVTSARLKVEQGSYINCRFAMQAAKESAS